MENNVATAQIDSADPWAVADNAKPRDFEYYGQVMADVWFGYFPGGGQKPVPFDASQHPVDKRTAMIEIQILPLTEQNISRDIRQNYTDFAPEWTKITLPSIKALGVDGLRAINNHFVRVAMVDGKQPKKGEDGKPNGEYYKTFRFLELYPDEHSCKVAFAGKYSEDTLHDTEPQQPLPNDNSDGKRAAMLKFAAVIVANAVKTKGKEDVAAVQNEVTNQLAAMPMLAEFFTGDSPEVQELVLKAVAG